MSDEALSREVLDARGVELALREMAGWTVVEGGFFKAFEFADFRAAFGFLTQVALLAERSDHHPEIRNTYRRVELRLRTHSAGGLTQKDVRLAIGIDNITKSLS